VSKSPSEVEASLAEMDRKVRELQRELGVGGGDRGAGEARPSQLSAIEPAPPRNLRAVNAEPDAPGSAPAPAGGDPERYAQAIVAAARVEAARISQEAAERVAAIGRQIDELAQLRDELEHAARALGDEYADALRSVEPQSPATQRFEGTIVVNAGPFVDMEALGAFERALARLPHVEDVCVRGLEGNSALIDLRLGH
jgi:hypothetical protein